MMPSIIICVEDLFFLAKIQETAKALGVKVLVGDPKHGATAVAEAGPQAIIVDLNSPAALDWIRTLKSDAATSSIRTIAFASHVQGKVIADARAAGCDAVMARSAFSHQLPDLLRSIATPKTP